MDYYIVCSFSPFRPHTTIYKVPSNLMAQIIASQWISEHPFGAAAILDEDRYKEYKEETDKKYIYN